MACVHGGEHQLEVIFAADGSMDGDAVVRWCRFCGSVAVDKDCDNRTSPGAVLPMQTPSLLTEHIGLAPQYAGRPGSSYVYDATGTLGLVHRVTTHSSIELWQIERCNFSSEKQAASALAILVRAGFLPRP